MGVDHIMDKKVLRDLSDVVTLGLSSFVKPAKELSFIQACIGSQSSVIKMGSILYL